MKKSLNKVLKFRRTISFIFSEKMVTEEWTLFGMFTISTRKAL